MPGNEAAALIDAHPALARQALEAHVAAVLDKQTRRLAVHREMPLQPGNRIVPRFDEPRPAEPLGWDGGRLVASLSPLFARRRHPGGLQGRARLDKRRAAAAWERRRQDFERENKEALALAAALAAGDPAALDAHMTDVVAAVPWPVPIEAVVAAVDAGTLDLRVYQPDQRSFPSRNPIVDGAGRAILWVDRSADDRRRDIETYALSVCLRLAAEALSTLPTVDAVTIRFRAVQSSGNGPETVALRFDRYRWVTFDPALLLGIDPAPAFRRMGRAVPCAG